MSEPVELLQPVYSTPTANEAIELAAEPIKFEVNGKPVTVPSKVTLRFLPTPRLTIQTERYTDDLVELLNPRLESIGGKVEFPARSVSVNAWATTIAAGAVTMRPDPHGITALAPIGSSTIKKVVFHLLNFPDFMGPEQDMEDVSGKLHRRDKVALKSDGWRISISLLANARANIKLLTETGGHAITHVGLIEREDGALFGVSEAEDLLKALHFFLSMACGYWCAPILYVGFDDQGNRVWEHWGIGRSEPWHAVLSWFDSQHGSLLEEVFPGFHARWRDPIWNEPLKHALGWYLHSNTGSGVDVGIVHAQAGLELLAWNYLVIEKKTITPIGFKKLWASDNLSPDPSRS